MPCAGFTDVLPEYAGLSPAERTRIDSHVACCGACRELLQALHTMDAELTAEFAGHTLSADFGAAVQRRVRREAAPPAPSRVPEFLDSLGWAAIVALIGLIVWWAAPLATVPQKNLAVTFNMLWIAASAFLFIGVFVGLRSFAQLKH